MNFTPILIISLLHIRSVFGNVNLNKDMKKYDFIPPPHMANSRGVFMKYGVNNTRMDETVEDMDKRYRMKFLRSSN